MLNPLFDPHFNDDDIIYNHLSAGDRLRIAHCQAVACIAGFIIVIIICALFNGCTTPKITEQHHHHHYEADTLAIQSQVDRRMGIWQSQIDSSWHQTWQDYSASWFSHDDQRERVTETITTYVDSLGREIRQEQRTTDRSLSRLQHQSEQRLSREFELRLRVVVDSVNDVWQHRFNTLQSHYEQSDSSSIQHIPIAPESPWHKRWWQSLKDHLLLAAILLVIILTRNLWLPLFRLLLKKC